MKKVTVSLEGEDDIIQTIMEIFQGKDGAENMISIIKAKTDVKSKLYDKAFDKALRKMKPGLFEMD